MFTKFQKVQTLPLVAQKYQSRQCGVSCSQQDGGRVSEEVVGAVSVKKKCWGRLALNTQRQHRNGSAEYRVLVLREA